MAGIVYEQPATPAGPPATPIGPGFSPQSFRDKKDQYDNLLQSVLSQRTTGVLDGLAKMATAGLLGWRQSKNQDKADSARAGASADTSRLLEALMGGGKTAPAATPPGVGGSDKLTNALVQSRGGPALGNDVLGDGKLPADMVHKESRGNQFAANGKPLTSPAGAIGIAQVMPGTAPEAARLAGVPFDDNRYRTDAAYNEQLGSAYYDAQMSKFGDPELARAAYNAGPGRVDQYVGSGRPLPAETVQYADLNGDGRIGGTAPQGPQQGPQVAAVGQGDMPLAPGGPEMPASMQPGYQPIGSQVPQQQAAAPAAPVGQQPAGGGNAQLQAALAIMSNPWADEGQKQVAGLILQQAMKQDQPVNGIEMGNRLVNPRTGAVIADFSEQGGSGAFEGKAADIQAANYLVAQGKMTREQAAQWLLARQAVGPNGQVDLITPDALSSGQSVGGAPAVMNGQPMGAAPPVQPNQPGVVTVRQPGMANLTEGQGNAALYADRMRAANAVIDQFGAEGQDRGQNFLSAVPFFGNSMVSSGYQQNDQAQRDFVTATLRRESGAAISESEFTNARKQYFPQPGDSPEVIEQKRQNRLTAINGIARAAGPAYFNAEQQAGQQPPVAPQPQGVPGPQGAAPPVQPGGGGVLRYDAQGNRIQ
ncbi:transglycosylase SLT domain-containing protein [Inquilinus sp. YAF38]|uniref:transglycosylase SLT domain-containing protein n=1 Tax=Inquilinus sp. YAF38 TaxID=3233084 RepID=UPI003F93E7D2